MVNDDIPINIKQMWSRMEKSLKFIKTKVTIIGMLVKGIVLANIDL